MATLTTFAPNIQLFNVHKNGKPLVWPLNDTHAIVSFKNPQHALYVATVTESHYKTHKEWPSGSEFSYKKEVIPTILGIQETSHSEMGYLCALWNLKLLVIEDIDKIKQDKYSFDGNVESFDLDKFSRVQHLNSLLWDPGFSI